MTRIASSLALIVFAWSVYASETDKYVLVKDVFVTATEDDLEASKDVAIEQGKRTAFEQVVDRFCKSAEDCNISDKQLDECVDSFSISTEKFIGNTYQAYVDYKLSIESITHALKKSARTIMNNTAKRFIVIRSNDTAAVYNRIRSMARQNSVECVPYSFSNTNIKFYFSEKLNNIIHKANIKVVYETVH